MKVNTLLCILVCFCLSAFGQKGLSGRYLNESGSRAIVIHSNDSLKLIVPDSRGIQGRTLAEATFERIDNNFIEINSIPPYILLQEGIVIKQSMDSTVTDSLKLSFSFPNYDGQIEMSISVTIKGLFKNYDFNYSEKNKSLMLPRNIELLIISINNPIYDGELDGSFYGFRRVTKVYQIEKNVNNILINIPAMDESFFEKYYIKGEYAKISKDSITWKGEVFVKEK